MSTRKQDGRTRDSNSGNKNKKPKKSEVKLPENERLALQKHIADFLESSEHELVLPGLAKAHRKYLHTYANRIGLRTRSYGKEANRVLHIERRKKRSTFGDAHKLALSPATRLLLMDLMPTIRNNLPSADRQQQQQWQLQQKQNRLRGEALLLSLGPRLVPPRANRISNELYRDKQELPICRYQEEIVQMLKKHSIVIVNGDTGSGKTTQVPQYILSEATRENRPCRVLVSQPRRVACVSVAQRVAEERGEQLGDTVGYQIRMESRIRKTTNLIYTTSGCLLRSIMADVNDLFRKISHLIIDEIHERDKYTDFTLITIKEQLKRNKDLRVILMSATMDIDLLSKYFDDCPVLNVPGQGYDVKIYYLEDILYHTGYRTALMEKYLRMSETQPNILPAPFYGGETAALPGTTTAVRLCDQYLQEMLDSIMDQFCEPQGRCEEELCELFDQIQYYIQSEGMSVDAGHSLTGMTPLMAACKCNYPKYVELFMQRQANIYIRDAQGLTAVDYALAHTDGVCMYSLQNSGAALQQHMQFHQVDLEKQRIMAAYHQQFNDENEVDHDLILSLLEGLYRSSHPGAIMVFLPGYNDILQQRDLINSTLPAGTYRICILHGQMDSQDQIEALQWQRVRKIILSTNIGQTSITIPDLAYVIDSGKVKMKAYDSVTESSQLQSVWISKADANQRSGRAGRTQNGVCYRLYSFAKYQFMMKFCPPEFMRIPLTEICLYAKTLDKNCDVQTYLTRALNPPTKISVHNAVKKLQILQVFNDDESVTELGQHLVEIPLDVQLGKCLLFGIFLKCFDSILTIVAFHSVKDPFILPTDRATQGQASFQRKSFSGESFSDQIGILELYKGYMAVRNQRKRVRQFCSRNYLSQSAMEMFCATRRQIADLLAHRFRLDPQASAFSHDLNVVRFCLTAGFYPNVAVIDRTRNSLSTGAENQLILQRTSALNPPGMKNLKDFIHQMPHDWIVFYEKARVANMCSINMNTVVAPVVVALQCGRECILEGDDNSDESIDEVDDDIEEDDTNHKSCQVISTLKDLSIVDNTQQLQCNEDGGANDDTDADADGVDSGNVIMSLDNWIRFELNATDAKMLLLLRNLVQTQFFEFLRNGQTAQAATTANCLQKLLQSLDDRPTP